jgi:cytochrome c peroxidase
MNPLRARQLAVLMVIVFGACGSDAEPRSASLMAAVPPAGFPSEPLTATAPADNALTEARARLGRRLFFDPQLSRSREISCGTCHRPERAFADADRVSAGVDGRRGTRNAPALVNLAWGEALFWDGRARTLEQAAGEPIENPDEMDLPLAEAVRRLRDDQTYQTDFSDAYGGPPSEANLPRALANFVRTLVSSGSAYDRFMRGDGTALSGAAQRGLTLFNGKGGCFRCHPTPVLTNNGFFNNGTSLEGGDPGRKAMTGRAGDLGKFKVPGLRNVAVTAPYMHDGSLPTLEAVVDHYARGGDRRPNVDPLIQPLELGADEKAALVVFMRSLTDDAFLTDRRFRP